MPNLLRWFSPRMLACAPVSAVEATMYGLSTESLELNVFLLSLHYNGGLWDLWDLISTLILTWIVGPTAGFVLTYLFK